MKVVCVINGEIKNSASIDHIYLTIGKSYEVFQTEATTYFIIDDKGETKSYFISRFITTKEYRKRKLEKLNII